MTEENPLYKTSIADSVDVIRELKSIIEERIKDELTDFHRATGLKVRGIDVTRIERLIAGAIPRKSLDVIYQVSVDVEL
jgi:hypothetical protein